MKRKQTLWFLKHKYLTELQAWKLVRILFSNTAKMQNHGDCVVFRPFMGNQIDGICLAVFDLVTYGFIDLRTKCSMKFKIDKQLLKDGLNSGCYLFPTTLEGHAERVKLIDLFIIETCKAYKGGM